MQNIEPSDGDTVKSLPPEIVDKAKSTAACFQKVIGIYFPFEHVQN